MSETDWSALAPLPRKEPVEIIETKDIILPLTYTKTPDVILSTTFTPHDTLRFDMNFKAYLRRFNPEWRFLLVPKEIDGTQHLCVEIYNGASFVSLDDVMVQAISSYAFLALNEHPGYTLIVNSHETLKYRDVTMPSRWVKTILPFISLINNPSIVTENGLYVNLEGLYKIGHPQRPLEVAYNSLYATILTKLRYLYVFGSVVLDELKDSDVIRRWNLTVNPSLVSPTTSLRIYHALWHQTIYAANKSQFLERVSFDDVIISIPNPQRVKLGMEIPMKGIRYTETEILARVETLEEANVIARKFLDS